MRVPPNDHWRRPYSGGWFRWFARALLVGGVLFTVFVVLGAVFGSGSTAGRALGLLIALAFMAGWLTFMRRVASAGVYVRDDGIDVRGFIRRVTIPWSDVTNVRLAPLQVGGLSGWPYKATAIWIDRRSLDPIQTPLNDKSAEFLGRRKGFASAFAALHDAWTRATL